jgi:hypothetical protein
LDIYALVIEIDDVPTENSVLANDSRRGDQFRYGVRIGFAIIVHEPDVAARERKAGAHSGVKAAGAAGVLFQAY